MVLGFGGFGCLGVWVSYVEVRFDGSVMESCSSCMVMMVICVVLHMEE